jgi:pimeloyl-ACP methyl ester carboxylesterase
MVVVAHPTGTRVGQVLLAADGVRLSARHDPPRGSARDRSGNVAFVVAHGFTGSWRAPTPRAMARVLSAHGGVVAFDFRGHGASSGMSTVGDLEVLDLDAAVAWARLLGYGRVVTVGWSMGAGVAVRHAALAPPTDRVDALVAVSGPSRWYYRGTRPMRWLHRGIGTRVGRGVMALGFSTRIAAAGWDPWPEPPDALVARVAPTPLLLVHGDRDRYFPLEHARWLAQAAGPAAELWVEPGMGHAEAGATPALLHRIARWAEAATSSARMPG